MIKLLNKRKQQLTSTRKSLVVYAKGKLHYFMDNYQTKQKAIYAGLELLNKGRTTHFKIIPNRKGTYDLFATSAKKRSRF